VGLNRCPTEELKSLEGVLSPRAQSERNSRSLGLWRWLWLWLEIIAAILEGGVGVSSLRPQCVPDEAPHPPTCTTIALFAVFAWEFPRFAPIPALYPLCKEATQLVGVNWSGQWSGQ